MGMTIDNNDKSMMIFKTPQGNDMIYIDELKYHSSWDWLMPVAEKCLTTNEPTDGQHYFINDALLTCNIDVVYDRVVEFIKEYNFGESMEEVSIFDFLIHINTQDK